MRWNLRYSAFAMREIPWTRGLEPIRSSDSGVRNSFFGVRSSEFVLRSSEFILRNSFFGVDSSTARDSPRKDGRGPSRFRIRDAGDPLDSSPIGILNSSF